MDAGNLTIYTDHEALKAVFKSTGPGKQSNRLNNWALFLFKYVKRIEIIHQSGKTHRNTNGLSHLKQAPAKTFLTDVITIEPNLKKLLVKHLLDNRHLDKIYTMIQQQIRNTGNSEEGPKTMMHSFRINNTTRLLYMDESDEHMRLYIPEKAY